MITSFFPGRIRLRALIFKEADLVEKAEKILRMSDAVNSVEHNFITGSVLVTYTPEKLPAEKLNSMQDFFMALASEAQHYDGSNKEKISRMIDEIAEKLK